jgi:hypothetical protein
LCLVVLAAVMKLTSRDRPFEPISRAAGALAALVAIAAGFWFGPHPYAPFGNILAETAAATNASRPNFLLIVLDTVRADHLDLFGYQRPTMPNLKRFALEEAQLVTRTFTPGSWTLPSHASMFTGMYPSAHGAHYPFVADADPDFLGYPLPENLTTLAEFVGTAGYQTAGIVANFGMLSRFGLSRGFQHYVVTPGPAYFAPRILWVYRARLGDWPSLGDLVRTSLPAGLQGRSRTFSVREPGYRRAWEITAVTRQWLERHGSMAAVLSFYS